MIPSFARRLATAPFPGLEWGALALCLLVVGCHRDNRIGGKEVRSVAGTGPGRYEVRFAVTRLKDHRPLSAATLPLDVGRKSTIHQRPPAPTEDTPAVTDYSATLVNTRTPGEFQLVTKVALREANRNKKGKLKRSQRNEGALLPIRVGETQNASASTDPVQIEVHLERR